MKILLILLYLFSIAAFATEENKDRDREILLSEPKSENISAEDLNKFPEVYQFTDSVLSERDSETGINSEAYYTRQDRNRVSISYSLSQDYEDPTKVQTADIMYFNQFNDSYRLFWWGVQAKITSARYDAIAEERVSLSGDANSDANTTRDQELQSFTILGVGLAHRFKVLSEAFGTDRMFEFISVFGNYILHVDSTDEERYTGFGYTAEYNLSRRTGEGFFYGGKVSYNWALVQRPQVDEEKLADRSLVFGWTSFGLEIGYIF